MGLGPVGPGRIESLMSIFHRHIRSRDFGMPTMLRIVFE